MVEKRVDRLEEKVDVIANEVMDSKQALSSIAKDIHVMSEASSKMEAALSKLLETEVKFQLHAQEMKQNHSDHQRLIAELFDRVDEMRKSNTSARADIHAEITSTVNEEVSEVTELVKTNFRYTLYMIGAMMSLFLSYVAYNDYKFDSMSENIDKYTPTVIANDTEQKSLKIQVRDLYFDIKEIKKDIREYHKDSR